MSHIRTADDDAGAPSTRDTDLDDRNTLTSGYPYSIAAAVVPVWSQSTSTTVPSARLLSSVGAVDLAVDQRIRRQVRQLGEPCEQRPKSALE